MPRWLLAFILALLLPCYGLAAAGQPLPDAAQSVLAYQPLVNAPMACEACASLDQDPRQHDASDDVSAPAAVQATATDLPRPSGRVLPAWATPYLEGAMRPPSTPRA